MRVKRGEEGRRDVRQWKAQSPAVNASSIKCMSKKGEKEKKNARLSVVNRMIIQLYAGMRNVSRRMGFTSFSGWPM